MERRQGRTWNVMLAVVCVCGAMCFLGLGREITMTGLSAFVPASGLRGETGPLSWMKPCLAEGFRHA